MRLDPSRRLGLSRHAGLKKRADGIVLVLPERALRVGGSGGEILELVAEGRCAESIVAALRERHADAPTLEADVLGFLDEMIELGGVAPVEPARDAPDALE